MIRPRTLALTLAVPVLLLAVLQLVPYGRQHRNPPDGKVAAFDSPETERLAQRACYDCHSNRTQWPWYAWIAPLSWRIQNHVEEGRSKLNFTAFDPGREDVAEAAGEASETVTKGEMPPRDYLLLHPEARLTQAEKRALAGGLDATFAAFAEHEGGNGDRARRPGERSGRAGAERGQEAGEHEEDEEGESGAGRH